MRLRAYDTVNISSVQSENLRPGQEFEISDSAGTDLMKTHPGLFAVVSAPEAKAEEAPQNKAEPEPANKAAPEPISAPARRVPRG